MNIVRFSFILFFICFGIIVYRLFLIQVARSEQYIPLEKYLHVERALSLRGEIHDVRNVPLAVNKRVYDVYVDTAKVRDNSKVRNDLMKMLSLDEATMSAVLEKKNWQKLAVHVEAPVKSKIEKYYPTYINLEDSWVRDYPEGSRAAYLLGFVGKDDVGNPQGYIGIEGYFERELRGLPSVNEQESDVRGVSLIGGASDGGGGTPGVNITLTVDETVQSIMEEELTKSVGRLEAKYGCGIVMAPQTGEIRALGCVPSFDPEKYYEATPEAFINPLVSTVYEPGSTFKPLIVAMGVEEKKVKKDTVFDETGPYQIGEYSIKTWNNQYHGKLTVENILEQSSNVGMVQIIQKMDKQKVESYLTKLGLRKQTGIELQGEAMSLIRDVSDWKSIDYATLSFGQGMAITPMQLVAAFSSLANGGYYRKPTLVKQMEQNNEALLPNNVQNGTRVFSQATTREMETMLNSAVDHSEAKYKDKPAGYKFCGKTGTAQIPIEGHYDPNKTVASFIGFYPCNGNTQPQLLMFVLYREPKASIWGSETAAPSFFAIAKRLLLYYNISPSTYATR